MENIIEKIKAFFVSSKNRSVMFVIFCIIAVAAISSAYYLHHLHSDRMTAASITAAPTLSSLPGVGKSTNAYIDSQNNQNEKNDVAARKNLTSAVPTITRPNFKGSFSQFYSSSDKNQCPLNNKLKHFNRDPAACTLKSLKLAKQAGVTAEELACQGCSCPVIREAGFSAGSLKDVGYSASQLRACGFTLQQLVTAGFSAKDLKAAGFTAAQLKKAGFTAAELKAAGFTAAQLKKAGFTAAELKAAGFTAAQLKKAGFTAAQLKAVGFTAAQLKKAGFTATQLKAAGFTAGQLKAAGFTAAELKAAGFTAAQLKKAGFTAAQLKASGFTRAQLKKAGFTPNEIAASANNGAAAKICSVKMLKKERAEGYTAKQLRAKGCGLAALKAAGFTAKELKDAGFTAAQLKAAGFTAKQLKTAGFTAAQLKAAGFNAAQLKAAGFTAAQLKAAGFNAAQLKAAGFTAAQLKAAGFNAAQLKAAGFTAKQLKKAGFTAAQLKKAGFNAAQLHAAGFKAADLAKAGFTAKQLADAGLTAAELKAAGFSPEDLKHAGFTKGDLLRAGFSPAQAGFVAPAVNPIVAQTSAGKAVKSSLYSLSPTSAMPSADANSPENQMARLARMQQRQMTMQQHQDEVAQMQSSMASMSQKLLAGWSASGQQKLTATPQLKKPGSMNQCEIVNGLKICGSNNFPGSSGGVGSNSSGSVSGGPIMKAGSIMFAVLQTSIDSDDVGTPIMAKIVTGKLKGAKLMGRFSRINTHLVMRFNLLNEPNYPKSIAINSYAIDPDTARTALSGSVNEHYMQRYGTLFASSFLEGIGDAFQTATNSMAVWKIGGASIPVVVKKPPNATQAALIGLGKVGSRVGQDMGNVINRPPTVKLQAGTGIGILIMSDLHLPVAQTNATGVDK